MASRDRWVVSLMEGGRGGIETSSIAHPALLRIGTIRSSF